MARPKPSSAANGRLSHGPTTQEGKDRSRFNAVVHGLTAKRLVLLKNESREDFYKLANGLCHTFTPDNTGEELIVDSIVANEWRLRRAQSMSTVIMQDAFDAADPDCSPAEVIRQFAESKAFDALNRYEATLHNKLDRSARRLAFIRKNFPYTEPRLSLEELEREISARHESEQPEAQPTPTPPPEPEHQPAAAPTPAPLRVMPAFAAANNPNPPVRPEPARPDRECADPHLGNRYAKAAA